MFEEFTRLQEPKLRVFEAFSGIGTQRMALRNLGIPHEVVAIAEIDKFAIKSYEAIHGETNNLGDISQIETADIPDHDLFTYSFPCQDISVAGKGSGLDIGSGTRSGLLWECQKVIAVKKPKYLLLENVKNLVGKKHKHNFDKWLEWLEELGYTNYWEVLNAKDYGIPQNRERVFVVSILGDHEPYEFPKPIPLELRLKDVLEDEVDEKFYLSKEKTVKLISRFDLENEPFLLGGEQKNQAIKKDGISTTLTSSMGTGGGYVPMVNRIGGIFDSDGKTHQAGAVWDKEGLSPTLDTMQGGWRQPSIVEAKEEYGRMGRQAVETLNENDVKYSDTINPFNKRVSSKDGVSPTLTTRPEGFKTAVLPISQDLRIRKLTPKECWRLMGCTDEDFHKAEQVNSNSQLYKQAGNAIVVDVLEKMFEKLFSEVF